MTPWTDLGRGIRVRRSALYQMNSTVLLDPEHAVVVDPGALPSEIEDIARVVRECGAKTVTLVFTHAHWDHVLGRPWWPSARTLAHDHFHAELMRGLDHIHSASAKAAAEHGESYAKAFEPFHPNEAVSGLHFMKLGPWRVVVRDAAGHSESQISIHLPEQRALIAADMLSDIEIPILHAPCATYRTTLETLKPVFDAGAVETLIPGHGEVVRSAEAARARLLRDLAYLEALERGVRKARADGLTLEAVVERLAAMDYVGKDSKEYSMVAIHLENIRQTHEEIAAGARAHR